jgi:outer membrane protein TolC
MSSLRGPVNRFDVHKLMRPRNANCGARQVNFTRRIFPSAIIRNYFAVAMALALAVLAVIPQPIRAQSAPVRITLDQAIDLALKHNHSLQALRSTIQQNQAMEITANLRPNPTINGDAQFIPLFNPSNFTSTYLDNGAQFDLGIGYLFERGQKRQHRLAAAKDATAVTVAQVTDAERTLTFNVGTQFVGVLLAQSTLDLADQDVKSFQQTVDIGQAQYKAGAISEGDFLKIKLQLLQFQSDVATAKLAKVQALAALRNFIGFAAVPDNFDVDGDLEYQPVHSGLDDLKAFQELNIAASEQALSDVVTAYEGLHTNDQIILLYRGGFLDESKESRDISEYAYRRGAASLMDFLDAERTYRSNELAYRQALASYMLALEQLRDAVGTRTLP